MERELRKLGLAGPGWRPAEHGENLGRPLEPLILADVLDAGDTLRKRAARPKSLHSGQLTYRRSRGGLT
jgi:hypothetical protein